jgi:hypothetical protein
MARKFYVVYDEERVEFDVRPWEVYDDKKYSLSEQEFADYEATRDKYEGWQRKLGNLKPDGYVAPTPFVPTKGAFELRAAQETEAYLDEIAPLPGAA